MDNPFRLRMIDGNEVESVSAEDRIGDVKRFNRGQCNAALNVPDLQKTVVRAIHARLKALPPEAEPATETVRFRPWCIGAISEGLAKSEVEGEPVDFGLVLHSGFITSADAVGISDPVTGYRVTGGADRTDAIANLAALAASFGGADAFEEALTLRRHLAIHQRETSTRARVERQAALFGAGV